MRERRNAILIFFLTGAAVWAFVAWIMAPAFGWELPPSSRTHRWLSLATTGLLSAAVVYCVYVQDKLRDQLGEVTMGRYYEQDGLCFMPLIRVHPGPRGPMAEISLYYQNRFENPCEAVIHLRPPPGSFHSHRGARDVHFAFTCDGGAFGVIHQPVAIAREHQGEPVAVELAAAVRWPRGHGDQLRSHAGRPCGTFDVDWALAYRQSAHELNGEIALRNPAIVAMTLATGVCADVERAEPRIEVIQSGTRA